VLLLTLGAIRQLRIYQADDLGGRIECQGQALCIPRLRRGEFPAAPTGELRGSVWILPSGGDFLIGTDLDKGLALEKKPGNKGGVLG